MLTFNALTNTNTITKSTMDGIINMSSGFAGLPGGFRDSTGDFKDIGAKGRWWSSDGSMSYSLFANDGNVHLRIDEMTIGFSVRCLKD